MRNEWKGNETQRKRREVNEKEGRNAGEIRGREVGGKNIAERIEKNELGE